MDYQSLLGEAWNLTWRRKRLWWAGLFGGSTVASLPSLGGQTDLGDAFSGVDRDVDRALNQPIPPELLTLVAGGFLVLLLVGLLVGSIFWLIGIACRRTLILSAAERSSPTPRVTPGPFGTLAIESILVYLPVILIGLGFVVTVLIPMLSRMAQATSTRDLMGQLLGFAGPAILVALLSWVLLNLLGIIHELASREIVLRNRGVVESLRKGAALAIGSWKSSAILWVIDLAASISAGICAVIVAVLALIPFGIVGLILGLILSAAGAADWVMVLVIGVLLAPLYFVGLLWGLGGFGAFKSYAWTLGYLRLSPDLFPPVPTPEVDVTPTS
jgi:hypothetical protein